MIGLWPHCRFVLVLIVWVLPVGQLAAALRWQSLALPETALGPIHSPQLSHDGRALALICGGGIFVARGSEGAWVWSQARENGIRISGAAHLLASADLITLLACDASGLRFWRSADGGGSWNLGHLPAEHQSAELKALDAVAALKGSMDGATVQLARFWRHEWRDDPRSGAAKAGVLRALPLLKGLPHLGIWSTWSAAMHFHLLEVDASAGHQIAVALRRTGGSAPVPWAALTAENPIIISSDAGRSWADQPSAGKAAWTALAMSKLGGMCLALAPGRCSLSNDAGRSWRRPANLQGLDWSHAAMSRSGRCMVVASGSALSISEDAGVNWRAGNPPASFGLSGLAVSGDGSSVLISRHVPVEVGLPAVTALHLGIGTALDEAALPLIITVPPTDQGVIAGAKARLTVQAMGEGMLSYQWYEGLSGESARPLNGNQPWIEVGPLSRAQSYWCQVTLSPEQGPAQRWRSDSAVVLPLSPLRLHRLVAPGDCAPGAALTALALVSGGSAKHPPRLQWYWGAPGDFSRPAQGPTAGKARWAFRASEQGGVQQCWLRIWLGPPQQPWSELRSTSVQWRVR